MKHALDDKELRLAQQQQQQQTTVLYCTVLYCAHLAIFMQYTGVFPTIQLEIPSGESSNIGLRICLWLCQIVRLLF